jgi:hypothetical protein
MGDRVRIELELRAPFLTGNAGSAAHGFDAVMRRTQDGRLAFPGTLVRGVLRDCLRQLLKISPGRLGGLDRPVAEQTILQLFGAKSQAEDTNGGAPAREAFEPVRAKARFGDLVSGTSIEIQTADGKFRIQQGRLTAAAAEGMLQRVEIVGKHGNVVPFACDIELDDGVMADNVRKLVDLALRTVTALGTAKSAGFGRIHGTPAVSVVAAVPAATAASFTAAGTRARFRLEIDGPLVIDTERDGTNVYRSSVIVPGSALKAAFAETGGATGIALENVRFSHAFPVRSCELRPTILPLSLSVHDFLDDNKRLRDEALNPAPCYLRTAQGKIALVSYEVDWKLKFREFVETEANRILAARKRVVVASDLVRQTAVRTAIDPDTGAAAIGAGDVGQLFVQEAVLAKSRDGGAIQWRCEVEAKDENAMKALGAALVAADLRLGKLRARARLTQHSDPAGPGELKYETVGGRALHRLVLQTPAVMFEAAEMRGSGLKDLYLAYFLHAFNSAGVEFALDRFFARQSLRGGYQGLRFRGGRSHYAPWVITNPGSTFVLSTAPGDAQNFETALRALQGGGLPVADTVKSKDWRDCPFLPENGFGQFALNLFGGSDFPLTGLQSRPAAMGA